jgi:Ran GTPase-activating protein (RanGAP) involved in mRNA processing and transport
MMSMLCLYSIFHATLLTSLRFGNYIGEAESDEEHEEVKPQAFKFDEAFDEEEEEEEEVNDQQLMEVDGMLARLIQGLQFR